MSETVQRDMQKEIQKQRTAVVITVSDKGARGERRDSTGPALRALLQEDGWDVVRDALVADETAQIREELIRCADDMKVSLVVTAGGTGFSPRDVTPEATLSVLERLTPGIPEQMRAESMKSTPRGCLSRSVAGIRGRTLIVNLPGSPKGARENLRAVLGPIHHGIDMLLSDGSADCAEQADPVRKRSAPSLDMWLQEAKAADDAHQCGMYLFHTGVVRATARRQVREGEASPPVTGMHVTCSEETMRIAAERTRQMPGIRYVRAWLNEGDLDVGDPIMLVLVGGDTRPHVLSALDWLVDVLKTDCITEQECIQ